MTLCTSDNPKPVPLTFVVKKGEKILKICCCDDSDENFEHTPVS